MTFGLILDILIAVLLVTTIAYAVMLNRRLKDLRNDQDELEKLSQSFNDATLRAEESITKLTSSADGMKKDVLESVRKAENLRDDLNFLIERAGMSADKLEDQVRTQRAEQPAKPVYSGKKVKDTVPPPEPKAAKPKTASSQKIAEEFVEDEEEFKPKTDAERELLKALQSVK